MLKISLTACWTQIKAQILPKKKKKITLNPHVYVSYDMYAFIMWYNMHFYIYDSLILLIHLYMYIKLYDIAYGTMLTPP